MTEEQLQQFREITRQMQDKIDDFNAMLDDYAGCKSETSKKFLGAAILKMSEQFKQ